MKKKMFGGAGWEIVVFALAAVLVGGLATSGSASMDGNAVAARQKLMKANGKHVKALRAAMKASDFEKIAKAANGIAEDAKRIPAAFKVKDLSGKTAAHPKIWDEKDKFDAKAEKLMKDAQALAAAAKGMDMKKVMVAAKTMGRNCGACHKAYRVKKK